MSRDSERRLIEARDAAESASHHKSEFLSSVSHEIRTPLNTVLGMAELLGETELDERQRHYVRTLQHAGDHLLALIDDVLDMTRIEAGSLQIEAVRFDIQDLVESSIEIVRINARHKQLELAWSIAADVPRVLRGDTRRLRQVLVNLLGNAVKFTDQGRVVLHTSCDAIEGERAHIHFSVRDTGIGIPSDRLSAIFSGFVQGDGTIASRYGGFGLGLDIAKRIVERMEGKIWAESELDRGSCFHVLIELPIEDQQLPAPVSESRSVSRLRVRAANGRALRVLVVDDSEDSRTLLGEFLTTAGVLVEFADDGPAAIAKATSMAYDVVLMDLQMPGLDGYDTTREIIRALRDVGRAPPPIVALSAHALTTSLERSIDAGCAQTLTKPIRKRVLIEAIANVVSGTFGDESPKDDLAPLLPKFFANRRKDVVTIQNALDRNDFDVVVTLAHNMRGTGTSFGFPELSAVGDELEAAARAKSLDACRAGHAKLAEIVARIQPG